MTVFKQRHWQLLATLPDGLPQHMPQLGRLTGIKPQQLSGFWQQMPPHTRGLLRQRGGQWRLMRPLAVFNEAGLDVVGREYGFQTALEQEYTSDNDVVLERTRRSVDGTHKSLCVTHLRSKGRGRQGKSWNSRLGECLMFSFGWPFDRRQNGLGTLILAVALACSRALVRLGLATQIKWLSDSVVGRNKLDGALIETVHTDEKAVAVVGIGINFALPRKVEDAASVRALFQTASQKGVSAVQLLGSLLDELNIALMQFGKYGFEPIPADYQAANRDQERPVILLQEERVIHERAVTGVTGQGALWLNMQEGEKTIVSGEISLQPNDDPVPIQSVCDDHYLLLDGSGSQPKWAWAEDGAFHEVGCTPYRDLSKLGEEWAARGSEDVKIAGYAAYGDAKEALAEAQLVRPAGWLASMAQGLGIRNHYHDTAEHGSDRWFNALGSRHSDRNACVIVSYDTAVTTGALTDDDHYLGGTIMPGFHLMRETMALGTANLNHPIGKVCPFPTTTSNALTSGMVDAVCGASMVIHGRLKNKIGSGRSVDVVVTDGGTAKVVQALPEALVLDNMVEIVDNLIVYGLFSWIEQK